MNIQISKYNLEGKKSGNAEIITNYKDLSFNQDLIHQIVTGYQSNMRQILAHTKTRGEVSGGGRKPWKQKGTGRARIGSSRAPHWTGGGVVFGPRKNRNFKKLLPTKMRRKALAVTLAKKNEDGEVFVIETPNFNEIKTQKTLKWLQKLPLKKGSILLVLDKLNPIIYLSTRNLSYLLNKPAKNLNCLDLLQFDNILLNDLATVQISEILTKNKGMTISQQQSKNISKINKTEIKLKVKINGKAKSLDKRLKVKANKQEVIK